MQSTERNTFTTPPTEALLAGSILNEYRDLLAADQSLIAAHPAATDCQTCGDPTCRDSDGANALTDCQTCGDPTCKDSDGPNALTDCQTCGDPTCKDSDGARNVPDCQTCGDPTCRDSDGPHKPHHPPHHKHEKKAAGWIDLPRM